MKPFIFFGILIFTVVSVNSLFSQNNVIISTTDGSARSEQTVSIVVLNPDPAVALQLTIPLSDQLTYVENSFALNADRINNHTFSVRYVKDTLKIIIYSLDLTCFKYTGGELFSFKVRLGDFPGYYELTSIQTLLSDSGGGALPLTLQNGGVKINTPLLFLSNPKIDFGKVPIRSNHTQLLKLQNIGNLPLLVSRINCSREDIRFQQEFPLTIHAGEQLTVPVELNSQLHGEFTVDAQIITNSVKTAEYPITINANPFSVNEFHVLNAEGNTGDTITVGCSMMNMEKICGFQTSISIDTEIFEFIQGSFELTGRKADHSSVANLDKNILHLVAFSPLNNSFEGEEGPIAVFKLYLKGQSGSYQLIPKNTLLTTNEGTNFCSATVPGTVEVKSPMLSLSTRNPDFGVTPVNEAANATILLKNEGKAVLEITSLVLTNPGFKTDLLTPFKLTPGQSYPLSISYSGQVEGQQAGELLVYSNSPGNQLERIELKAKRYEPNELNVNALTVRNGFSATLEVGMANFSAISAVQFDLTFPSSAISVNQTSVALTKRSDGHHIFTSYCNDSVLRVLIYSLGNTFFKGSSGKVVELPVQCRDGFTPGLYSISLSGIVLSNGNGVNKSSSNEYRQILEVIDQTTDRSQTIIQPGIYCYSSADEITIENNQLQSVKITIVNINGQLIHSSTITNTVLRVGTHSFPSGAYIIELKTNQSHKTIKFIKN